jgi:hypothetical protein
MPPPMDEERTTDKRKAALAAVALLVLVTVPLALWGTSSGDDPDDALTVEVQRGAPNAPVQVILSFRESDAIAGEPAQGQLRAECHDAGGQLVVSGPVPLPLDTDNGQLPPHAHVNATSEQADRIRRCTLIGFEQPFSGRVR